MLFPSLYLIADPSLYKGPDSEKTFFKAMNEAMDAGVSWIQYRDKKTSRRKQFERAKILRDQTREHNVVLIINDEIDLALAVRADGVHLGQDDFPVEMARKLLGKEAILGLSTHHLKQAKQAESEEIDYIGYGPVFKTETKQSQDIPVGLEGLAEVCSRSILPIYAIGGIQFTHLPKIISAGATGLAVASALVDANRSKVLKWLSCLG